MPRNILGKTFADVDGWSESLWKSLAIKSLRIGWPIGLENAAKRLKPSTVQAALLCGMWEDIFPTAEEIPTVLSEIRAGDYESLCRRQTHHARGYTQAFCAYEPQAVAAATEKKEYLWSEGKRLGVWLPPRSLNCFWTWLQIQPEDAGQIRSTDHTPWIGMPAAMADGHTKEGKIANTYRTLLSGHYENHLSLANRIKHEGWQSIRREVHSRHLDPPESKRAQILLCF